MNLPKYSNLFVQETRSVVQSAVKIVNKMSQGDVILGDDWRVIPHDDLLQNLKEHYGSEKVHLQYA